MSDIQSKLSDYYSIPSSDNRSSRDRGSEDAIKILYPDEDESQPVEKTTFADKVHVNPTKLRLRNTIRTILGETTEEYLDMITTYIYKKRVKGDEYPSKHKTVLKYVEDRLRKRESKKTNA